MAYSLFTHDLFYNGDFPAWVSHQPDSTPSQSSPNKVTIGSSSLIKLKSAFIRVAVSLPIAFLNIYKQGRR